MKYLHKHWTGLLIAIVLGVAGLAAVVTAQSPEPPRGKTPAPGLPPDRPTGGPPVGEGKTPPTLALPPGSFTKLPAGQRAADLALPVTHGSIRLLPTGTVPAPLAPPLDPARGQATIRPWGAIPLAEVPAADRTLLVLPPYIPAGWILAGVNGAAAIYPDGTRQSLGIAVSYERPGYFPITIGRKSFANDFVELTNWAAGAKQALTLSSIRGVPVLIDHQAPGSHAQPLMKVMWAQGNVFTIIEAPALDLDEMLKMADALIAAGG